MMVGIGMMVTYGMLDNNDFTTAHNSLTGLALYSVGTKSFSTPYCWQAYFNMNSERTYTCPNGGKMV